MGVMGSSLLNMILYRSTVPVSVPALNAHPADGASSKMQIVEVKNVRPPIKSRLSM